MSVARYPFSLTLHLKHGSQLLLDGAIHLNGKWEMCITQLCIPKSQITLFRDCFIMFNYNLQPKTPVKTEKDHLWNAKLIIFQRGETEGRKIGHGYTRACFGCLVFSSIIRKLIQR